jgi:hypothetical protein
MLTGGCLCGGVRFELGEPLDTASYCHCTRCQRRTGTAASASVRTAPDSLRIVQGEELLRSWQPEDGNPKVFCSVCGAHLWAEDRSSPGVYFVRLGSFDTDPGVRPSFRQFVDYAAAWEPIPDDGLPRYPERRPPATA